MGPGAVSQGRGEEKPKGIEQLEIVARGWSKGKTSTFVDAVRPRGGCEELQRPRIASPEGTGDVRRSFRNSPHLLVVGAGNSRDPGPVWLMQEAKRGIGGGGGAIGVEIAPPPHHRCLRTPPGLTVTETQTGWKEEEERKRLP
jgi:hypothetical protein